MRGFVKYTAPALLGLVGLSCLAGDPDPFRYFVGSWTCDGHVIGHDTPLSTAISAEWDEHTMTLTVRHDVIAPHAYHAVETWGATKSPGQYHDSIADRFSGVRWFSSEGWKGDCLTWSRSEEGREIERFVYSRKGDKAMTVNWLVSRGDADPTLAESLDCKKQ